MTLWRRARTEAAGACRSVRYDLGRPAPDPDERAAGPGDGRAEVTSTGCHAFAGAGLAPQASSDYPVFPRPRRLAAVSAFGVLAVAGAAGSFFAVATGIGGLTGEKPTGAEPYPLSAGAPRDAEGELSNSGLGRGSTGTGGRAAATAGAPVEPATRTVRVPPGTVAAVPVPPEIIVPRPTTVTVEQEIRPTGCCLSPPVPTPTAPAPTPHSPPASAPESPPASPDDNESASPDDNESASPEESESPEPSGTPEPSESPEPSGTPGSAVPTASGGSGAPAELDEGERRDRHARRH